MKHSTPLEMIAYVSGNELMPHLVARRLLWSVLRADWHLDLAACAPHVPLAVHPLMYGTVLYRQQGRPLDRDLVVSSPAFRNLAKFLLQPSARTTEYTSENPVVKKLGKRLNLYRIQMRR